MSKEEKVTLVSITNDPKRKPWEETHGIELAEKVLNKGHHSLKSGEPYDFKDGKLVKKSSK